MKVIIPDMQPFITNIVKTMPNSSWVVNRIMAQKVGDQQQGNNIGLVQGHV